MRIVKQKKEQNRVFLEIEVDYSQYFEQLQKVIKEAAQKIKVPGFRVGKAPESIVKQHINMEYAKQTALDDIVQNLYGQIIKEANIEPVDYPTWKLIKENDNGKCIFTIEVDVIPEVTLGKYIGLNVEKESTKVDESEVDDYIRHIQEEGAVVKEVFRPAKEKDIVELDIKGYVDGKEEVKLSQDKLPILLGENRIAPNFDENIYGMNIGEIKEFVLTLPKDYFIQEFSQKEVLFKVKLNRVIERILPEFNDDYVKRISSFENVESYKADVKKRIEEFKKEKSEEKLKDDLLSQIIANSKVDLPDSMIKREIEQMLNELETNLSKQGLDINSYLKSRKIDLNTLKRELYPPSQARVKAKLVLNAIANKEKIEFTEDDFASEVKQIAQNLGLSEAEVMAQDGIRDYIKDYVLRRKALDFVVKNAKIKEKK